MSCIESKKLKVITTKEPEMEQYYEDYDYGSGNYDYYEETFGHRHHFLDDMRKSLGIHRIHRSTAEGRKGNDNEYLIVQGCNSTHFFHIS